MSNLQTTVHYRKAPSMTVWHLSFCRIIFVPQLSLLKTSQSHGHSLLPKACAPYLSLLSHAEVTSQAQEISVTRRNLETRHPLRPDPRADTFPERNNWVSQAANSPVSELLHQRTRENRTTPQKSFALASALALPLRVSKLGKVQGPTLSFSCEDGLPNIKLAPSRVQLLCETEMLETVWRWPSYSI